jgi:hypothetical protein
LFLKGYLKIKIQGDNCSLILEQNKRITYPSDLSEAIWNNLPCIILQEQVEVKRFIPIKDIEYHVYLLLRFLQRMLPTTFQHRKLFAIISGFRE